MILKNESALVGTNCSVKFREIRINPRTQDRSLKSRSIQERSLTKLDQGERETHRASLTKLDQGECETHRASLTKLDQGERETHRASLTKLDQGECETHRASLTKLDQGECETYRASAQCSVYDVEVFNRAPTFTDQRLR